MLYYVTVLYHNTGFIDASVGRGVRERRVRDTHARIAGIVDEVEALHYY